MDLVLAYSADTEELKLHFRFHLLVWPLFTSISFNVLLANKAVFFSLILPQCTFESLLKIELQQNAA